MNDFDSHSLEFVQENKGQSYLDYSEFSLIGRIPKDSIIDLSVIIPCYNESERLDIYGYSSAIEQNKSVLLIFVNDGSKDSTISLLKSLVDNNERIVCLDLKQNVGKAEAVRKGFLFAYENIGSQMVGFYDADMATPFKDIIMMSSYLSENQLKMIVGCRFKRMGGDVKRRYSRFLLGRIFATCAANVLQLPVYDTQCGAKVLSKSVIPTVFDKPFVSKWLFDIELFARIIINNGYEQALNGIIEYPLSSWKDVGGSKLTFKDVIRQPMNLLKINNHYKIKKYVRKASN